MRRAKRSAALSVRPTGRLERHPECDRKIRTDKVGGSLTPRLSHTNDKTWLENNHVENHGIVESIGVFGDAEIFLDLRPASERKVQWAPNPLRFIRLRDIVRTNRDKPAIANLELTMESNKPFRLPTGEVN